SPQTLPVDAICVTASSAPMAAVGRDARRSRRRPLRGRPAETRTRALVRDQAVGGSARDTCPPPRPRSGSALARPDTAEAPRGRSRTCTVRRPAERPPAFALLPETPPPRRGRPGECT